MLSSSVVSVYSHRLGVVLNILITYQESLTAQPTTSEIIWNFARLQVGGRASAPFTLKNNLHFYPHLPENEGAFGPQFIKDSTKDFFQLKRDDTVYVLVDRPGRVFIKAERRHRTFGNVWMLNGTLLFKGLKPPPLNSSPDLRRLSRYYWTLRGRKPRQK